MSENRMDLRNDSLLNPEGTPVEDETEIALAICPQCGEPVIGGSHKCNEMSDLIREGGPNSLAAVLYTPILKQTKAIWGAGRAANRGIGITIRGIDSKTDGQILNFEDQR